jgi:hypothetical protein
MASVVISLRVNWITATPLHQLHANLHFGLRKPYPGEEKKLFAERICRDVNMRTFRLPPALVPGKEIRERTSRIFNQSWVATV